jgi:hypothetical protein
MSIEKTRNIDFLSIIKRIKEHKKLKHDWEVANLLGYSREAFSERKRRNSIPVDKLEVFCERESINIDWILYEKGPKYRERKEVMPGEGEIFEGFVKISVYSLAGAGNARELASHEPITLICIPKDFYQPSIKPVIIQGDSMYPTILDGAIVGVAENDKKIISGKIYAVYLPYEGAVIKRLFVDKEKVILKPDNILFPTTEIPFIEIQNDNFLLGRVRWVVQKL